MNRTSKMGILAGGNARRMLAIAAALTAGLTLASTARAALTLTLSEPGAPGGPISTTITDNGAGDQDLTTGSIEVNDPNFGDFKTNILVGFSNRTDPTAGPVADLEVQSLDVTKNTNVAAATLIITLQDTGFTFPGNAGDSMLLSSSLAGTVKNVTAGSGDNVTFQSTSNPSGTSTPVQSAVLPAAGTSPVPFTASPATTTATFVRGAAFDLSNTTTITLSSGNESTNLSGTTTAVSQGPAIPEPTTLTLLGLAALPMLHRRPRRRA